MMLPELYRDAFLIFTEDYENLTINEYKKILSTYGPPVEVINVQETPETTRLFDIKDFLTIIILCDRNPSIKLVNPTKSQLKKVIEETFGGSK